MLAGLKDSGSLEFPSAHGCLDSKSGFVPNLPITCSRSRTRKCEGVIRRKLIPSVIDASTISNDMTSDEFPPLMGGELCILMSPAPLISRPGIKR